MISSEKSRLVNQANELRQTPKKLLNALTLDKFMAYVNSTDSLRHPNITLALALDVEVSFPFALYFSNSRH